MEPVKINTSSWHFQFIQAHVARAHRISDICEYRQAFVKALFFATLRYTLLIALFGVAVFVLAGAVMGVYTILTGAVMGVYTILTGGVLTDHMSFGLLLVGVVLATILFAVLAVFVFNRIENASYREPGPVREMYLSWKGKYCKPVQLSDE